ncbi:MAG: hypothetical protein R3F49_23225 [Planctomycetota bacterium]
MHHFGTTTPGLILGLACLNPVSFGQGLVDLDLRAGDCVAVHELALVDLHASTAHGPPRAVGALEVVLRWDPAVLTLVGVDGEGAGYDWLVSGFLPDPRGLNLTFDDGDALYTALARPGAPALALAGPEGLLVTGFSFRVEAPCPMGSTVAILPDLGALTQTAVYDFFAPAVEITGEVDSACGAYSCPLGLAGCPMVVPNSTGRNGRLEATGSVSTLRNGFTLTSTDLPLHSVGILLCSRAMGPGTMPASSQGVLCLAPPIGRGAGGVIFDTGSTGSASLGVSLIALPQPNGHEAARPGESWSFQAWHRDLNPGITSNLSNTVTVTFE